MPAHFTQHQAAGLEPTALPTDTSPQAHRRVASDEVFDRLIDDILSGELVPGSTLPAERALATSFGVNRAVVREALKRLEELGLVTVRHGNATRVEDPWESAGLEALPYLLRPQSSGVDLAALQSVLELRTTVGADVARWAAKRATAAELVELSDLCKQMVGATPERAQQISLRYWEALVAASGNQTYRMAFTSMRRVYDAVLPVLAGVMAVEFLDARAVRKLNAALTDRDAERAARRARRWLDRGNSAILAALQVAVGVTSHDAAPDDGTVTEHPAPRLHDQEVDS